MNAFLFSLLLGLPCIADAKLSFAKADLYLSNQKLKVEIADTPALQQRGLMYRTKMAKNEGMLFIFPDERLRSFWMKNTFIDLSIGFFDKNRKLTQIMDMKAVSSEMETNLPRYKSLKPARYVLEVNKGWFKRNKIKLGTEFKLIR